MTPKRVFVAFFLAILNYFRHESLATMVWFGFIRVSSSGGVATVVMVEAYIVAFQDHGWLLVSFFTH